MKNIVAILLLVVFGCGVNAIDPQDFLDCRFTSVKFINKTNEEVNFRLLRNDQDAINVIIASKKRQKINLPPGTYTVSSNSTDCKIDQDFSKCVTYKIVINEKDCF